MLHNCLNRAVKERLIVRNPADDVIVPKIDKKEMKILPPEQVKAYLKAASVRGVLPLFYLELTSGLRKGEIAALLWSDLDVENCTLSVTKQLVSSRDGELKITQPKTATSVSLDGIVFHDREPQTVAKCVADFFAGKSADESQKYIDLCMSADKLK